jgi:hypothetical protein
MMKLRILSNMGSRDERWMELTQGKCPTFVALKLKVTWHIKFAQ